MSDRAREMIEQELGDNLEPGILDVYAATERVIEKQLECVRDLEEQVEALVKHELSHPHVPEELERMGLITEKECEECQDWRRNNDDMRYRSDLIRLMPRVDIGVGLRSEKQIVADAVARLAAVDAAVKERSVK